jgi:putative salt-induced outer membrane protein YdiY
MIDEKVRETLGGGGGGGNQDMNSRVTRLEVEFEHVRKDLDEIRSDLKDIKGGLAGLATKRDITQNNLIIAGLALAVVGVFVAVLTYLQAFK